MTPHIGDKSRPRPQPHTEAAVSADAAAPDLANRLIENLHHQQAKLPANATRNDWYAALAYSVRERVLDRYISTLDAITGVSGDVKVVAYLSAEFLVGPHLGNSLVNLGLRDQAEQAVSGVGQSLS